MEGQGSTSMSPPDGSSGDGNNRSQLGGGRRSRRSSPRGGRSRRVPDRQFVVQPPPPHTDFDQAYFQAYSHVGVHEEMIKLYMAPVTHPDRYAESVDFWRNVYRVDMSPIMQVAKQCAFEEPSVETNSGENVLTWPHLVKYVGCYRVTVKEVESVTSSFKFQSMMRGPFHGFAFWFDVEFGGPDNNNNRALIPLEVSTETNPSGSHRRKRANPDDALVLSTAPEDPPTHWQQTMVYFYDPIDVEQDQCGWSFLCKGICVFTMKE